MAKRFVAGVVGIGLALVWSASSAAAPPVAAMGTAGADRSSSPTASVSLPRGVAPGIDVLLVPDVATAQKLVGASDRVESGNVEAYVATYSPESDAGYYAVTRDQGISYDVARARLSGMSASGLPPVDASAHQTILVFSRFTSAEIDKSLATLTSSIESTSAFAAFYYDPADDSIRLGMQMSQPNGRIALPITDVPIKTNDAVVADAYYRENMPSPFRGGGTIYDTGLRRCTSGIPAYNASGIPGYFTAAHCFSLSSWVFASSSLAGGSNTGTVTHRYGTGAVDAEFVSGKTYTGRIYSGFDLSVSKPIVGTYFPAAGAGNRLCFSSSTTGNQCGNSLVTYAGHYCGSTGCNDDLLALRGGVATEPGDSGGPLFANFGDTVKVSGIIRGLEDPPVGQSTTYAVDWRKIASTYAATLMYG